MTPLPFPIRSQLSAADQAALTDLYVRGTPENTLHACECEMVFGAGPEWPEREGVAPRFVLDHARDLSAADPGDNARIGGEALIEVGQRTAFLDPGCDAYVACLFLFPFKI